MVIHNLENSFCCTEMLLFCDVFGVITCSLEEAFCDVTNQPS